MAVEWDLRAADTHLASACEAADTSLELAHPIGAGGLGYPAMSIWATIAPDDPNEREDILITSMSGAIATVKRGVGYSSGLAHRHGTPIRLGTRAGAYPHDPIAVSNFQNSWSNFGGGFADAAYQRTPDGLVILRGFITGGTVGTAAFTLPGGWRCAGASLAFATVGGGSVFARVDVETTGAVKPQVVGSGRCSLDGIVFWAGA